MISSIKFNHVVLFLALALGWDNHAACVDAFLPLSQSKTPLRLYVSNAPSTSTDTKARTTTRPQTNAKNGNQQPIFKKQGPKGAPGNSNRTRNSGTSSGKNGTRTQQPENRNTREPWNASFHVSKKTQQRIQQAAEDKSGLRRTSIQRASDVLKALLNTPPQKCNSANVVCALTLSVKVVGRNNDPKSEAQFRDLLLETLAVLHTLVSENRLNSRQLCNAVWAIAKHYDRDEFIMPVMSPRLTSVSSEQIFISETWDLSEGSEELTPTQKVDATVDLIASELAGVLRNETLAVASRNKETKLGEICMASWAFGILRPRHSPPGWQAPPQMGHLAETDAYGGSSRNDDFITFEQWTVNDEQSPLEESEAAAPKDATDELFDAVAEVMCRPKLGEHFTNASIYEPPFELMRLADCKWNEIANVAWAFEKHGRHQSPQSEMLLRSLAREAAWRMRHGGQHTRYMLSRDISQLVWALGTLQSDNFRLSHDLIELVEELTSHLGLEGRASKNTRPFKNWSCADIVQVVLSLAHARIDNPPLLQALFQEASDRLSNGVVTHAKSQDGRKTFLAWEISVLLWAQASLYLKLSPRDVFDNFSQKATKSLHRALLEGISLSAIGVGPQEQANIAWALTVLEQHQSEEAVFLLRRVFQEAADSCKKDSMIQLEHAHQLWQAIFLLEEESPSAVTEVSKWFRDYLLEKWNMEKSRKKISSARHRAISEALSFMRVAHVNEHDEDIDVAIVLKRQASWTHQTDDVNGTGGMKVAVEFDGPNHFTRKRVPKNGEPDEPVRTLGHTVLKYRILKRQGWTVIRVPYYEFDKIPFWASMERQRYLQRLLKTHANIKFSDIDISEYKAMAPMRHSRFD